MKTTDFSIHWHESAEVWDDFVEHSPQGSVFSSTHFVNALGVPFQMLTVYEKQKIVAGTVLLLDENGKTLCAPYPFTPYQGFLLADNSGKPTHRRSAEELLIGTWFIEQLVEKFGRLSLVHSWRLQDIRPFQWYNYHTPEMGKFEILINYTGILRLKQFESFDIYLNSIRSSRRQEMRLAIKKKLTVQMSEDIEILDKLHKKVFDRQGLVRTERQSDLLKSIAKISLKEGFGRLKVCYMDEMPISAILFIFDKIRGYYMFAGNDPEFRESGASTFLMLDLIAECFDRGLEELDFVGINSPNRGDYKQSFNAEITPYFITNINTS